MGEPIKECWDRRQYHTGLAHIKRNRRTQFGILGAAIKPKWDGPTYPKGMTQLTNVAGPTLVKPAGPLQVSGLKILTSQQSTSAENTQNSWNPIISFWFLIMKVYEIF